MTFEAMLDKLRRSGNYRSVDKAVAGQDVIDFSSNDYLGLGESLAREQYTGSGGAWTSSASRLLASSQDSYKQLEKRLSELYDRPALLFNSGYHANTGLIPALCRDAKTLIVADKLVHASIIDGIRLSGVPFERFRHNDLAHLVRILQSKAADYERVLVVVEGVYSMDGDMADIDSIASLKDTYPNILLYVDEAHSFGVNGLHGLGICRSSQEYGKVDVVIGTFGKAAASAGAFAALRDPLRDVAVNCARSFIFSTALPPVICAHTLAMVNRLVEMDGQRAHLAELGKLLAPDSPSHIVPIIVGDSRKVCELSQKLLEHKHIKVLPIRTPTVPPGTERLRVSLSAARSAEDVLELRDALLNMSDPRI